MGEEGGKARLKAYRSGGGKPYVWHVGEGVMGWRSGGVEGVGEWMKVEGVKEEGWHHITHYLGVHYKRADCDV